MNKLEQAARQALEAFGEQNTDYIHPKALERFAALVAAHEREACAKVCEERLMTHPIKDDVNDAYQLAVKGCAAAIRGMK